MKRGTEDEPGPRIKSKSATRSLTLNGLLRSEDRDGLAERLP